MIQEIKNQSKKIKNDQMPEIKEKEEKIEQQEDFQSSTSASNLNKSIDNLAPSDLQPLLDRTEKINTQSRRKLSAPISITPNIILNIEKIGKGAKSSYYNMLISKGLLC